MRVKDWEQFQHFANRRPPWIKLYRHLLDDLEWHRLDGDSAKILIMLWLLASEDPEQRGTLPATNVIAFRFRISEAKLNQYVTKLDHWLIHEDIDVISPRYQSDRLETETETETETDRASAQSVKSRTNGKHRSRVGFIPPSLDEVGAYIRDRSSPIDPEAFVAYYAARGWKLASGVKMQDWKSAVITWEKRRKADQQPPEQPAWR